MITMDLCGIDDLEVSPEDQKITLTAYTQTGDVVSIAWDLADTDRRTLRDLTAAIHRIITSRDEAAEILRMEGGS